MNRIIFILLALLQVVNSGGRLTGVGMTVTITAPTSAATYNNGTATTINLSGTAASDRTVVSCTWTNDRGSNGNATGSSAWSISSATLTQGVNNVTVTCLNNEGTSAQDVIAITVSSGASNPIAAARQPSANTSLPNATWAAAGVEGGIPTSLSRCTTGTGTSILASSSTAAQINTALSGCDSGHYVELGSGSFSLSSGLTMAKSGVSLRGQGADSTKLVFSGTVSGCSIGTNAFVIKMCAGGGHLGTTDGGGPGPDNSANWTAGYSQGATDITLSATTGLTVGHTIVLDQVNDTTDGYPAAGDIFVCDDEGNGTRPCSYEGGGSYYRTQTNRAQLEFHKVTAINGFVVTISPGIYAPNFRSGQTPGAWWGDSSIILQNVGVDDLTLDFTGTGSNVAAVGLVNCTNCWVRGNRIIYNAAAASFLFHILSINTLHNTYTGNYLYGPNTPPQTTNYVWTMMNGSLNLFENNICDNNIICIAADDPESADVMAYNYVVNAAGFGAPGFQPHAPGDFMNLWEGNDIGSFLNDVIHGTHFFGTLFRNTMSRLSNSPTGGCAETCSGITLEVYSRFFNLLGNVISSTSYTTYESQTTSQFPANQNSTVFLLGWRGTHGAGGFSCTDGQCPYNISGGNDANVARTLFRWGNWDNVTSSGDNTSNDQTGTKWSSSEVPSGITNYPNSVPSAQTLPASLYLSAAPSWFGTRPLPMIGPDVVNGSPVTNTGAHIYKIPARYRYENGTDDAAYSTSSPRVKSGVACGVASCITP